MRYEISVEKHTFKETLYYQNEEIMFITIHYPSFESNEFTSFLKYLNKYYFSKFVLHSKYEICRLYQLAHWEYDYAVDNDFPFRLYEYYLDFNITYNKNCSLSLYYDTYTYTGGAHGNTIRKSDSWDLQTCSLMSLTDYIKDQSNYREFIIKEIIRSIEETRSTDRYVYFENYEQLVEESFQKDNFYLIDGLKKGRNSKEENLVLGSVINEEDYNKRNDGIAIYFQQYDIGPYVSGIITFFIPFNNDNLNYPSCIR